MVKCPRASASQQAANLRALAARGRSQLFSCESVDFSWVFDPRTGHMVRLGDYQHSEQGESYGEALQEPELDVVLADQRRPPTTEDQMVYVFVSHFFDVLLCRWEGTPSTKPYVAEPFICPEFYGEGYGSEVGAEYGSQLTLDRVVDLYQKKSQEFGRGPRRRKQRGSGTNFTSVYEEEATSEESSPDWRLLLPDEDVRLRFKRGARYEGRVSRRLMEGQGVYTWDDGRSFEGEFVAGLPNGVGRLNFPDKSFYEGQVYNAMRHGEGLQCMYDSPVMYSGHWWLGQKHGPGLIMYDDPTKRINLYKGHWKNNLKSGFGMRQYPSGAKYIGYWCKGRQHGRGVMLWANNDVYRGQWRDGLMHGYGEYTWNSVVHDLLSPAASNTYKGFWFEGKREGCGILQLLTGPTMETVWKADEKDGIGAIICSNGRVVMNEPLFRRDKPAVPGLEDPDDIGYKLKKWLRKQYKAAMKKKAESPDEPDEPIVISEVKMLQYLTSLGRPQAVDIQLHSPLHTLDLSHHLSRLAVVKNKYQRRMSAVAMASAETVMGYEERFPFEETEEYGREEKMLRLAVERQLCSLGACYDRYATMACETRPNHKCILLRLFLWQMLRDCSLHNRGLNLVAIDNILAAEKYLFLDSPHNPFEELHLWHFVHILIYLSWLFYGCYVFLDDLDDAHESVKKFLAHERSTEERGLLAMSFQYLLNNDILKPKLRGEMPLLLRYKDTVPLEGAYLLYKSLGEPHSARQLLVAMCVRKGRHPWVPHLPHYRERLAGYQKEGINMYGMTGEVTYNTADMPLNHPELVAAQRDTPDTFLGMQLSCLRELGPGAVVRCMAQVCPGMVLDGLVVLIEYQITFLEFYDILLLCASALLMKRARKAAKAEVIRNYLEAKAVYDAEMLEYNKNLKGGKGKK